MNKINSSKIIVLTFGVLVVCFLAAFYVVAWQEPSQAPPEGNVATPLNISATAQTKEGDLTIGQVDIKGDGSVSTNLNSDKLDDYHAADLMAGGVWEDAGSYIYPRDAGESTLQIFDNGKVLFKGKEFKGFKAIETITSWGDDCIGTQSGQTCTQRCLAAGCLGCTQAYAGCLCHDCGGYNCTTLSCEVLAPQPGFCGPSDPRFCLCHDCPLTETVIAPVFK